jgi:hypothetical protein
MSDHSRPPLLSSPKLPAHRATPLSHPVLPTPATLSRLPPIPSSIPSFPASPSDLLVVNSAGQARAPLRSPGGIAAAASVASAPRGWGCGSSSWRKGQRCLRPAVCSPVVFPAASGGTELQRQIGIAAFLSLRSAC